MRIKRLNGMFTISSQLTLDKLSKLAEHGYKSIICNRPDGEEEDQPSFAEVAKYAPLYGLETLYIPIGPAGAKVADHEAFGQAIEALPKPILAYCRSGTRPAMLWAHWDQAQSGFQGGERRVAAMQVGALAPGNSTVDGRRAVAPVTTTRAAPERSTDTVAASRSDGVTPLSEFRRRAGGG